MNIKLFIVFSFLFLLSCRDVKKEEKLQVCSQIERTKKENNNYSEPKKMLPMKKVKILIGGCFEECSEPEKALFNYLTFLKNSDLNNAMKFIDSTLLKYNGKDLGREWTKLWNELKTKKREEAIKNFLKEMGEWVLLARDKKEVEEAIIRNIKQIKFWTTEAHYHFTPPPLMENKKYAPIWKYVLKPRGIEWLITEIDMINAGKEEK